MNEEDTLLPGVSGAMGGHSAWLQGIKSPLIKDDDDSGSKELKLRFDVSEYAPEEIMVKTVDNKLLVKFLVVISCLLLPRPYHGRFTQSTRRRGVGSPCTGSITGSSSSLTTQTRSSYDPLSPRWKYFILILKYYSASITVNKYSRMEFSPWKLPCPLKHLKTKSKETN